MSADIEAANEWFKTPQGSAALYNAGYFAKPHLVRAFIAGWRAKEAAAQDAERHAADVIEQQMRQREGTAT